MAANTEDNKPTTQKFSKGERSIPHHSQKASKYYPADDVAVPKKVRSNRQQPAHIRGGDSGVCDALSVATIICD